MKPLLLLTSHPEAEILVHKANVNAGEGPRGQTPHFQSKALGLVMSVAACEDSLWDPSASSFLSIPCRPNPLFKTHLDPLKLKCLRDSGTQTTAEPEFLSASLPRGENHSLKHFC